MGNGNVGSTARWKMFKNFLHNELGVSKDDIRAWVLQAVSEVADQLIREFAAKNPVDEIVERAVESLLKNCWGTGFKDKVLEHAGKALAYRLEISKRGPTPAVKETSKKGSTSAVKEMVKEAKPYVDLSERDKRAKFKTVCNKTG